MNQTLTGDFQAFLMKRKCELQSGMTGADMGAGGQGVMGEEAPPSE